MSEKNGRLIDAQAGRLIFPVISAFGDVIAFGGRVLGKTDFAKYKNTRETIVFNKSKTLYNINLVKKLKKASGLKDLIVVEGYMDTLSLFQAGFRNVVASMGTALTKDQARLAKRYADSVYISYDGDFAGQKGAIRGLEILRDEQVNVRVVPLPEGLDPDDVIKQQGSEGYRKCLDAAMPLIDFKLEVARRKYDLTKTEERRSIHRRSARDHPRGGQREPERGSPQTAARPHGRDVRIAPPRSRQRRRPARGSGARSRLPCRGIPPCRATGRTA